MFNFSTTTIINSDKDLTSDKALYSALNADGTHGAILRIKRDFTFEMPYITKVYKKVGSKPTFAEMTVDCDELISALPSEIIYPVSGRVSFYITLEGSEESVFANDFYQKGLPFSIGFLIKSADVVGSELASAIKKVANRFDISTVGRKLFDIDSDGSVLTFKCTDEYMRFKGCAILIDLGFVEDDIATYFDGELDSTQKVIAILERGKNGFGTFRQLTKDLRLPTAANTSWTAVYKTDKPIPGALYDQYIIYYDAPSETNPSLAAVGHATNAKTTHIFWVNQTYSDDFETVVAQVVGSSPVKDDPTAIFEEVD